MGPAEVNTGAYGPTTVQGAGGNFLPEVWRWLQLTQAAKQFAQSVDPRTRAGAANLAASLFGGRMGEGDAFAATDRMNEMMPGQFEQYSTAKAAVGGHLGSDMMKQQVAHLVHVARNHPDEAVRLKAVNDLHDMLFGGEVHAKGPIPPKGSDIMRERAVQQQLERHHQLKQAIEAKPGYDAEAAAQKNKDAMMGMLRRNGIGRQQNESSSLLFDHMLRGSDHPQYGQDTSLSRGNFRGHAREPIMEQARRQAILKRFYAQQQHNHRN